MEKISVIIPVYNTQEYLVQCVESLLFQTYQNWEALLIDDGSTDSSLEVCKRLSQQDHRIKVYHKKNKGASAARNYGLNLAQGEYVAFLDSDDAIHPLLFEEMIHQMHLHNVEMAFCNTLRVTDQQMNRALKAASIGDKALWKIGQGDEAERWFHIDYAAELCGINGMISRKRIGSLRFDETLSHGEDTWFKYALFGQKIKTAYSPVRWYYYRSNPKSLCQQDSFLIGNLYCEKTIRIRDQELQKGKFLYALARETELSCQLRHRYERCQKRKNKDQCKQIKALAFQEQSHPLFQSIDSFHKGLFYLCFKIYPLYLPINWGIKLGWKLKEILKR